MSDSYKDGEVVWVKWGNVWWPGEVWSDSRVPEDIITSLRKPVIAFVKFFQEESFEFVRSPNNICPYNAEKKMDFIKKGMDKYRSNNKVMTNFPADVIKAEQLTDGNVNILNTLETPTKSKTAPSSSATDSAKKLTPSTSSVATPSPVMLSKKAVGSYNSSVKVQNTTSPAPKTSDKKLTCTMCNFATDRMNLLMMHIKNHSLTILSRVNSPSSSSLDMRRSAVVPKTPLRSKELEDGIAEDVRKIKESMKETVATPVSSKKQSKVPAATTPAKSSATTPKVKQSRQRKDRKADAKNTSKIEDEKKSPTVKKKEESQPDEQPKSTNTELKNELLADWLDEEDMKVEEDTTQKEPERKTPAETPAIEKVVENSPKKPVTEKATAEVSRSIRNIPKKQRVSEIYIQPEPEKVELSNSVKVDNTDDKINMKKPAETAPAMVKKSTPQKASKRKHAASDSSNEPEKKKMSEESDDKILMATAELLNETEVPKLSNVQSPSTFHTNDIDKRNLPPKERNKRMLQEEKRAKNSPETVVVSQTPTAIPTAEAPVQIVADKPCDEKEKISTEYDFKPDEKVESITGHVVGTTNNDDVQLPPIVNSKNDRQELMLPHKKKQSSRFLAAEKLSAVIEPINKQEPIISTTTTTTTVKVKKNQKVSVDESVTATAAAAAESHTKDAVESSEKSFPECDSTTVSPKQNTAATSTTTATMRGQKRQHSRDSADIYEFQPEPKKVHKSESGPKSIIACASETICITSKGSLSVARRDSIKTTVANSVVVTSQVIITEATKQPIASTQSTTSHDMISSSSSPKQQSITSTAASVAVSPPQALKNALKLPKENVEEMKKQGLVTIENNKTKLTPKGRQKFKEFQNESMNSLSTTTSSSSILSATSSYTSNETDCSSVSKEAEESSVVSSQQEEEKEEKPTTSVVRVVESESAQKSNSIDTEENKNECEAEKPAKDEDVEMKSLNESDVKEVEQADVESKAIAEKSNESGAEVKEKEEKEPATVKEQEVEAAPKTEGKSTTKDESQAEEKKEETVEETEIKTDEKESCNNNDIEATEKNGDSTKETESDNSQEEKIVVENGSKEEETDETSKDDEEKESDTTELSQDSGGTGLIALQAETFGGPPNCFYLCRQVEDRYEPVDNQILVLNAQNALVPFDGVISDLGLASAETVQENLSAYSQLSPNSNIIINTPNGQKIELNQQTIIALHEQADENGVASIELSGESLELNINAILEAIAAQQDVQETSEPLIPGAVLLESADGPLIIDSEMPLDIHHPSVATQVSEALSKPILSTTVAPEIPNNPTKPVIAENASRMLNIEDSLASIGVTPSRDVPKSLELPITVTNPKIAETVNHRKLAAASLGTDLVPDFVVQQPTDNGSDD